MSLLDLESMRKAAADCDWTFAELADAFRRQIGADLVRLEEAVSGADAEAIRKAAHRLVGTTATCGSPGLAAGFRKLELAGIDGKCKEAVGLLPAVLADYREVERRLDEALGDGAA